MVSRGAAYDAPNLATGCDATAGREGRRGTITGVARPSSDTAGDIGLGFVSGVVLVLVVVVFGASTGHIGSVGVLAGVGAAALSVTALRRESASGGSRVMHRLVLGLVGGVGLGVLVLAWWFNRA